MPETAVDKNYYPIPQKLKIRPSRNGGWVQRPPGNARTRESHSQGEFR